MKNQLKYVLLFLGFFAFVALWQSIYIVSQVQQAIVLQFGELVDDVVGELLGGVGDELCHHGGREHFGRSVRSG